MGKDKFKLSASELNKAWKSGLATKDEVAGGGFEADDGRYKVALTAADRYESKASGRDQVMFEYTFLEGDYKGKTKRDYNGLDRAESIPFLMRKIEAMGFDTPEEIDDLEALLKKMVKAGPQLVIQLKTKGDFQNVYIQKTLDDDETVELPAETEEVPAEEKTSGVSKEEAPAEEEAELEVGMTVVCFDDEDKEEGKGEVLAIDEENEELTVKRENGKKVIYHVSKIAVAPAPKEAPKEEKKKVLVRRK